ncbi:hypothetical protein [Nonomuraea polychroma]|uniref:hypothetical protein n=1 Tax=Nonomuraea polychroma TaxID=46176 RepID=UPI0013E28FD7|nr:hypothetical protein [Nonomuraea polychroma]
MTIFQLGTNLRHPPRVFFGGLGGSGGPPCPDLRRERGGPPETMVSWLLTVCVSWRARERERGGGWSPRRETGSSR